MNIRDMLYIRADGGLVKRRKRCYNSKKRQGVHPAFRGGISNERKTV